MASRGPNRKGGATSKGQVRIIGGERRGHRLQFVDQGGDLRPSSDRMRETLFNWLQFELPGLRVLDLFAGSGVLGAEALSRGAQRAVLVEKKRERAADLKRQLLPLFDDRIEIHTRMPCNGQGKAPCSSTWCLWTRPTTWGWRSPPVRRWKNGGCWRHKPGSMWKAVGTLKNRLCHRTGSCTGRRAAVIFVPVYSAGKKFDSHSSGLCRLHGQSAQFPV